MPQIHAVKSQGGEGNGTLADNAAGTVGKGLENGGRQAAFRLRPLIEDAAAGQSQGFFDVRRGTRGIVRLDIGRGNGEGSVDGDGKGRCHGMGSDAHGHPALPVEKLFRENAGEGGQDKGQGPGPAAQENIGDVRQIHIPGKEPAVARGDGEGFRCLPELGLIYPLHSAGIESAAAHGVECLRGKG